MNSLYDLRLDIEAAEYTRDHYPATTTTARAEQEAAVAKATAAYDAAVRAVNAKNRKEQE